MKILSYNHAFRIWVLSDGSAISVDAHPEFRVGQQLHCVDGVYTLAASVEDCEV